MLCPPGAEGHACMDKCATGLKCQQFPGAVCRVNNCTSNCRIEFYIAKSWSPEEYCFPDVWIPPPSNSVLHVIMKKILSPLFWLPEKCYERNNSYYFSRANQQKAGTKIYSLTQCSLTVNECDWHILAGNDERINSHCLIRSRRKIS